LRSRAHFNEEQQSDGSMKASGSSKRLLERRIHCSDILQ